MVPPKRSLGHSNERALCLFICSVLVKQHTGLLEWAEEDQTFRALSKKLAQRHLKNYIENCRMDYAKSNAVSH